MPELPEVETMRRGICPAIGSVVRDIQRTPCRCRPIVIEPRIDRFRRRAAGKAIVEIRRAGKRVVIWLAAPAETGLKNRQADGVFGEEAIVIEPRMTGLVLLAEPPSQAHLRLRISLVGGPQRELLFWDRRGLGSVRLYSAQEFAERFGSNGKTIGPDALELSAEQLRERLCRTRRAIKVAMLDQRAVAGIGNLYASEILHLAGVHPTARCDALAMNHWKRIHAAILEILESAILHEGSTLSDGTYRNALNQSGGYQNHHRVYDRAGKPCRHCSRPIVRIVQVQRSTFFCSNCQKHPRPKSLKNGRR